jgi:hypothetical protein
VRKAVNKPPSAVKKRTATTKRKYSPAAGESVEKELHEFNEGRAMSGRTGKKVKNRKQAIAIGLSKARQQGKEVPPPPPH